MTMTATMLRASYIVRLSSSASAPLAIVFVRGAAAASRVGAGTAPKQKRKLWEKKIAFKYGGGNPLEWASTDSKHDPAPDVVIDYKKHWGQLSSERKQTKLCAQKNSRSSLVLGDEDLGKDAYWTSGHDLFSGRVGGADIAEQRRRNAAKRAQLCGSTLVLGSDTEYF